jgi:hypothetical protein
VNNEDRDFRQAAAEDWSDRHALLAEELAAEAYPFWPADIDYGAWDAAQQETAVWEAARQAEAEGRAR